MKTADKKRLDDAKQFRKGMLFIGVPVIAFFGYFIFSNAPHAEAHGQTVAYHAHVFVNVTQDGRPVPLPDNIGIDPKLWNYHGLDDKGVSGFAPLHTHPGYPGIVHIESKDHTTYKLSDLLAIWGLDFNQIKVYREYDANILGQNQLGQITTPDYDLRDGMHLRIDRQ